ncbi:3558_t:CDS:2, partial [Racocetra persica]
NKDNKDESEIILSQPKANLAQSIFNFCNVLMGIGILSLPLAFKYSGWIIGFSLLVFCMGVTNYAARLLIICLEYKGEHKDEHKDKLYTYPDIAEVAYGKVVKLVILALFGLELILMAVASVNLIGDCLNTIYPDISIVSLKIISWMVLVPLTLIDIKYLSYVSCLGILSSIALVFVIIIDGFTKHTQPGSLLNPVKTELLPITFTTLNLSFGLIIAGFAGHAVFPSIYINMKDPTKYPTTVNVSFAISTVVYILISVCGYLMFGNDAMSEVCDPHAGCFIFIRFLSRTIISTAIVLIAIVFPNFEKLIELLGSFLFYNLSAAFP